MSAANAPALLLIQSHYGAPPTLFELAVARGLGRIVRERDLTPADFAAASGMITTTHLDQIGFLAFRPDVEALLARGGRWFLNGHVMHELVPGLRSYVPIPQARRADLVLTRLAAHPIFDGVDQREFEENRGVAGFYGRGHNPMPEGAWAVNGVGPDRLPIDWDWAPPGGGRVFSHAGNDIGAMGGPNGAHEIVAPRILDWTVGGLN